VYWFSLCLSETAAGWQGLLNDLQRHHWMQFPDSITFWLASPVGMIAFGGPKTANACCAFFVGRRVLAHVS
jgi:hypothetical protein